MSEIPPSPDHEPASPGGAAPALPADGHTEEYPTLAGELAAPHMPFDPIAPEDAADADDEEWVPRTSHGIRLAIPLAALIAALLIAGGFWGGVELEKSHGGSRGGSSLASLASRFRSARTTTGSTGSGSSGFGGLFGGSSAAAEGTISVVDGNTLYVLTATGSLVKVTLSKSTTVTRNASAQPVDLRPGDTVTVQGTTAANGNVSATSVAATAPGVSSTGGGGFGGFGGSGGTSTTTTAG